VFTAHVTGCPLFNIIIKVAANKPRPPKEVTVKRRTTKTDNRLVWVKSTPKRNAPNMRYINTLMDAQMSPYITKKGNAKQNIRKIIYAVGSKMWCNFTPEQPIDKIKCKYPRKSTKNME